MKCSITSKLSVTKRKQSISNSLFERSVYLLQISENMVSLSETSTLLILDETLLTAVHSLCHETCIFPFSSWANPSIAGYLYFGKITAGKSLTRSRLPSEEGQALSRHILQVFNNNHQSFIFLILTESFFRSPLRHSDGFSLQCLCV